MLEFLKNFLGILVITKSDFKPEIVFTSQFCCVVEVSKAKLVSSQSKWLTINL